MGCQEAGFVKRLLRQEVVPSLGCTEPAAVAYAASAASALLHGELKHVQVTTDTGTFKNTLAVGLPGTSYKGPAIAAAAGALIANEKPGLKVFQEASPALWEKARELAENKSVLVTSDPTVKGVYVRAVVERESGRASVVIEGRHDRINGIRLNGSALPLKGNTQDQDDIPDSEIRLRLNSPKAILGLLEQLDSEDLDFIRAGVTTNRQLAENSLKAGYGLGFGKAMWEMSNGGSDPASFIKSWVAAGVEARMAGIPQPVITSGGSGNSGLTVTLGTWAGAKALGVKDEEIIWSGVALAHLFNVALKARLGRVGPLCGGIGSSATAVGCALAWMLGGGEPEIDRVVRYMIDSLTGAICDGAKPACALKIATGLGAAVDAARLAAAGALDVGQDGMGGSSAETGFERIVKLARTAYVDTDITITSILQEQRP